MKSPWDLLESHYDRPGYSCFIDQVDLDLFPDWFLDDPDPDV